MGVNGLTAFKALCGSLRQDSMFEGGWIKNSTNECEWEIHDILEF